MDGFTILVLAVVLLVFIAGIVCGVCAIKLTKQQTKGRGLIVLLAFFIPAIYVVYLMTAGHFRDEYQSTHSIAYEAEGYNNLKLGDGYVLWFFDETPWMSSIGRGSENAQITNIQRLSIGSELVTGQVGKTNMEDGPVDYFFSLNLASGALQKFQNRAELNAVVLESKPFERPEDLYNAVVSREHSILFWPAVSVVPCGLVIGLLFVKSRNRTAVSVSSDRHVI